VLAEEGKTGKVEENSKKTLLAITINLCNRTKVMNNSGNRMAIPI